LTGAVQGATDQLKSEGKDEGGKKVRHCETVSLKKRGAEDTYLRRNKGEKHFSTGERGGIGTGITKEKVEDKRGIGVLFQQTTKKKKKRF